MNKSKPLTEEEILRQAAAIRGRRGGKIGGASKSKAKRKASASNLKKARESRWPGKVNIKESLR